MQSQCQITRRFLQSQHSAFVYTALQHPNPEEQHYIQSYITVLGILRTESEPERVFQEMLFRNSNSNLQCLVKGLIYLNLLAPQQHQQIFNHIRLFRNQGICLYIECLYKLLTESFDILKEDSHVYFPLAFASLTSYKLLDEHMLLAIIRTMDSLNTSQKHLNYCLKVLEMLQEHIKNNGIKLYGRYLFMKLFKLCTILFLQADEQGLNDFRQDCLDTISNLWKSDKQQCLFCGNQIFRYFQQLLPYGKLNSLMQEYRYMYPESQKKTLHMPKPNRQRLLSVNLSARTTNRLILMADRDSLQLEYQFVWLYRQYEQNKCFDFVVIDILRYVLKVFDQRESKRDIICRIIEYCWLKPVLFEYVRQAIFLDWFFYNDLPQQKIEYLALPGLVVLQISRMELPQPVKFQKMLEYVLQQHVRSDQKLNLSIKNNIRKIFEYAALKNLFSFQAVQSHPHISSQIKQELTNLMMSKQNETVQEYQPFDSEPQTPPMPQFSEVDWGEQQYTQQPQQLQTNIYLTIQKEFVEQAGSKLSAVLEQPTRDNYQQLVEWVISQLRRATKQSDNDTISMLYSEIVKLSYVAFQSHFQEFSVVDHESNILWFIVDRLHSYWGYVSLELQFYKKMLKDLCKMYRIAAIASAYTYLFRVPPHKAYAKETFNFIIQGISREKLAEVFRMLVGDEMKLAKLIEKANNFNVKV